jgi:hypothetical protein
MSVSQLTEAGLAAFYLPIWIGDKPPPSGAADAGTLLTSMQEVLCFDFNAQVRLRVSREGYFHFDFTQHATAGPAEHGRFDAVLAERARFLNLVLAHLYTQFSEAKKAVELFFIDQSTIMSPQGAMLNPLYAASEYSAHQRVESHRTHFVTRQTFPLDRIRAAALAADAATSAGQDRDLLATMILQAFALHSSGQVEASLVTAWTVAERCINELWDQYLGDQETQGAIKLTKERRDRLGGIDFTASVVAEVLSIAGRLSHDDYERLSAVRKKRNKWVHKLATIDMADAAKAIVVAQSLLRAAKLLEIEVPFFPIRTWPLSYESE